MYLGVVSNKVLGDCDAEVFERRSGLAFLGKPVNLGIVRRQCELQAMRRVQFMGSVKQHKTEFRMLTVFFMVSVATTAELSPRVKASSQCEESETATVHSTKL